MQPFPRAWPDPVYAGLHQHTLLPPKQSPTRRGAKVLIANRSAPRAHQLVASMAPGAATVVEWEALQAGEVQVGRW